ncbi:MAG: alpha-galactoside ABC transporter substrate-binding protein [Robiginitomaculum sp.]|nr:MAG: alpha-galactoside ABC transporter substrate-binding protein [Robiginitomaculum sp.]
MIGQSKRLGIVFLSGVSMVTLTAGLASADPMPPEQSMSNLSYELLGRDELWTYRALDAYSEAPYLSALVAAGALPPIEERLPAEPLVHLTAAMSDGIGEYGGVFRHVIGGRPEGWNWLAGQHQGWGGINMAMQECLVRLGPLWQVRAEDQSGPLPNLAKSWEWNEDKTELTMHLIEGARWSDGDPFDTEDIRFWWEDNVLDANVTSRMPADGMGEGTTMTVIDDFTFRFDFLTPQGPARLQNLAYIQGCPGPSHVMMSIHPTYNPDATYESYRTGQPADVLSPVVMGMFVPVVHEVDELVIMRRNPYFWKVDETGQQLPYYNEMHFKLSTWDDRTTQTVAGTGDFSNMENPGNYVAALVQSQQEDSPVLAQFGPRVLSWRIELNFSDRGVEDDVDTALRELFRNLDFRVAFSHSLDREAIGQSIARGPFTYPYTGGFEVGSPFYDADSTVYFPYDPAKANEMFDALGLADTDGNGIRNLPNGGADLEIDMLYANNRTEDRKQLDAVTSMMAEVGVRILPTAVEDIAVIAKGGNFNTLLRRQQWVIPTREVCLQIPIDGACPDFHMEEEDGGRVLFDFERDILAAFEVINNTWDAAEAAQAATVIQQAWTENVYTIGTVQAPAALLINKRIRNAHPGTPVFMFEWAEDGVVRERLWTPAELQLDELLPGTIAEY